MPVILLGVCRVGFAHQRAIDADLNLTHRAANIAVAIIENDIAIGDFRACLQLRQNLFRFNQDIDIIAGLGRAGDFAPLYAMRYAVFLRHGLPSKGRKGEKNKEEVNNFHAASEHKEG